MDNACGGGPAWQHTDGVRFGAQPGEAACKPWATHQRAHGASLAGGCMCIPVTVPVSDDPCLAARNPLKPSALPACAALALPALPPHAPRQAAPAGWPRCLTVELRVVARERGLEGGEVAAEDLGLFQHLRVAHVGRGPERAVAHVQRLLGLRAAAEGRAAGCAGSARPAGCAKAGRPQGCVQGSGRVRGAAGGHHGGGHTVQAALCRHASTPRPRAAQPCRSRLAPFPLVSAFFFLSQVVRGCGLTVVQVRGGVGRGVTASSSDSRFGVRGGR